MQCVWLGESQSQSVLVHWPGLVATQARLHEHGWTA